MANETATRECGIVRTTHCGLRWAEAVQKLDEAFGWAADTDVYAYTESVSTCELAHKRISDVTPPVDAIEGRVFADPAEARWRRREDGTYDMWLLKETESTRATIERVRRANRRYYLIGLGTEEPQVFEEARYLPRRFKYPVDTPEPNPRKPNNKRRAFITVAEYERIKPVWSSLKDENHITEQLDAPLLCAHRFVSVGTDWGEDS
jgi:hypothetical protein